MFYCFSFSTYIKFFVKIFILTNVNISNELNISDVNPSVKYNGSLARGSFILHATQCSLYLDKPQKNGIHSSNKYTIYHMIFYKTVVTNLPCLKKVTFLRCRGVSYVM